jgi:catechol 2,3-dioxygenase-like lactoylglutathione lyase family enzyme
MHVAFLVDDAAFDATLGRLKSQGVAYGSQPNDPTNGRIDHPLSERGVFFRPPDGHLFELMASSSSRT